MLNFNSCLAPQFQRFIELRQLSGTDYATQALLLSYFDHFLAEQSWYCHYITRQLIEDYQCTLTELAPRTRINRLCVVHQWCEYLATTEPISYVPESIKNISSGTTHKPYIYSIEEIRTLMDAAQLLTPTNSLRPYTCRTLIGLLYTCGIRIGEALALNLQDFNTENETLFIADGKFHKSRWVPLTTSTCQAINEYIQKRCHNTYCFPDSPLFINLRHQRLRHNSFCHDFHRLLTYCGISQQTGCHPRVHDLRHTFAVSRLLGWYREGVDVNSLLPALATFMGHVNIVSTQLYLQPTKELLKQANQRFHHHYIEQVKPAGGAPCPTH